MPTIPALLPPAGSQRRCRRPRQRQPRPGHRPVGAALAAVPARPRPRTSTSQNSSPRTASKAGKKQQDRPGMREPRAARGCPHPNLLFPPRTGAAPRCWAGPGAAGQPGHRKAWPGPAAQPDKAGRGSKTPRFTRGDHGQTPHWADPAPGRPRTGQTPRLPRVPAQGAPLCPAAALTKPCLSEMLLVSLSL